MSAARAYVAAVVGPAEADAVLDLAPEGLATARAALGWLRQRSAHMGALPGTTTVVEIQQSPQGWSGVVTVGNSQFHFERVDEVTCAATIAAVVGAVPGGAFSAKTAAALGRTLDALVEPPRRVVELKPQQMRPLPRIEHEPAAPAPVVVKKPAPKKRRGVMVTQEAAEAACDVCGGAQAIGLKLRGCLCWSQLLSTARVVRLHAGWLVTPGPDWGADGASAFAEAMS